MPSSAGLSRTAPAPPTPPHISSDRKSRRFQQSPWSNWVSKAMRYTFTKTANLMPSTSNPSIVLSSTGHSGTRPRRSTSVQADSASRSVSRAMESTTVVSENSRSSSYHMLLKWSSWAAFATIIGFIINAAIIHPTFASARIARESLDMEQWTALKNYQDYCQTILKTTNHSSIECGEALSKPLPPPPSFLANFMRKFMKRSDRTSNGTIEPRSGQPLLPPLAQYLSAGVKSSGIFVWVVLVNVFFVVFLKAVNFTGNVNVVPFWAIMLCLILFDVPIGDEDSSWWTILMTGISMVIAICYCTS